VVVPESTEADDRPVRGWSVFERGWWKEDIRKAKEGREEEWEEDKK